jgi:probable rRNA maturation factor
MPVELTDEQDDPLEPGGLEELASLVLADEGLPEDSLLSITLVETDEMTRLNEAHMAKSGPTDVLAFPIEALEPGRVPERHDDGPPVVLGDVVVCPEVVRRQAADAEVAFEDEMALMVVHGVLHLLGYDHVVDADAELMERRERDLLALVGKQRP